MQMKKTMTYYFTSFKKEVMVEQYANLHFSIIHDS